MERLTYKGKHYFVITKISASKIDDPKQLKDSWRADLVLRRGNTFWILQKLIEAEFTDIKENK